MSVLTQLPSSGERKPPAVPTDLIWRLSVDQYHEMIRAGVLTEDDPVELLEGWLVAKMVKRPPHRMVTGLTREALAARVPVGWFLDDQEPITLDDSEPEPDVQVVRGTRRDYLARHPGPSDVALVVEVSDSSLERDRDWKKQIYARARIPVYWIINLIDRQVEVYTDPTGPAEPPDYRQRRDYRVGDMVPLIIDGKEVAQISVAELLA
jgi:Uma2 family endonuclease